MSEQEEILTDSQSIFFNGSNSVNINDENHLLNSGEQSNSPVLVEEPVEVEEIEEELIIDGNDIIIENSPAPVQQRNNSRNNRNNRGNNRGNHNQQNHQNNNNQSSIQYIMSLFQPNQIYKKFLTVVKLWFITFMVLTLVSCPTREWFRYNYSQYCNGGKFTGTHANDAFLNFVTNKIWYGHDHQCDQYVRWTKAAERMCPIGDLGISREIPTIIATATLLPTGVYLLKNIFGAPNGNNGNNHGKKNNRNNNRRNN